MIDTGFRSSHDRISAMRIQLITLPITRLLWWTLSGSVSAEAPFVATQCAAGEDWCSYNGTLGGSHYSRLRDITRSTVAQLQVAREYETRDELQTSKEADNPLNSTMESNPLIVG